MTGLRGDLFREDQVELGRWEDVAASPGLAREKNIWRHGRALLGGSPAGRRTMRRKGEKELV